MEEKEVEILKYESTNICISAAVLGGLHEKSGKKPQKLSYTMFGNRVNEEDLLFLSWKNL